MLLAGRCRAAVCGGARVLKPWSMLQSRNLPRSTASRRSQHQGASGAQAKFAEVAQQANPAVSAERAGKLTLALVSACAIAAASSLLDDNSPTRAASDMSAWSAQETAAFLASLGEAVGEEHVSTDEGE